MIQGYDESKLLGPPVGVGEADNPEALVRMGMYGKLLNIPPFDLEGLVEQGKTHVHEYHELHVLRGDERTLPFAVYFNIGKSGLLHIQADRIGSVLVPAGVEHRFEIPSPPHRGCSRYGIVWTVPITTQQFDALSAKPWKDKFLNSFKLDGAIRIKK